MQFIQKQAHFFIFYILFNTDDICNHQTRFLGAKYTKNRLRPGLGRKRIFGVFSPKHVAWLQLALPTFLS